MDYRSIMMQEQAQARTNYTYDPRERFNTTRFSSNAIEAFDGGKPPTNPEVDASDYTGVEEGSRSDPSIVQASPTTKAFKRYVIIDSSQRDWIKQPNPYTNLTYSFGLQNQSPSNPPVYTNNPFVPTFALEQTLLPSPIPGIPNLQGWTLLATPSNIVYPPYNSSLPKGNFLAYDTGYTIQPSGSGFGSVFTPCNVSSIRLVRAVLPQRQFLSLPIVPNDPESATIQSNLVGKSYSTFTTYPYLLLYLNEYFGQYVGGNEPMRRSFSVMTQKQRQQTNFETNVGVQQYDYEPWGGEALQLQSPITNLQKLAITVTDPIGTSFAQNDTLSVAFVQATSNNMFLKCFTGSFQYFSSNELRIGDRVNFYSNTIVDMLKSPILAAQNSDKSAFITALTNATFPVLELLDYVPNEVGIYVPRSDISGAERTDPYISSYNGFLIPNFVTPQSDGSVVPTYPNSIDPITYTVLEPPTLVGSNLAFLNVSLQPVYTLELETLQPDTTSIGGAIVL